MSCAGTKARFHDVEEPVILCFADCDFSQHGWAYSMVKRPDGVDVHLTGGVVSFRLLLSYRPDAAAISNKVDWGRP